MLYIDPNKPSGSDAEAGDQIQISVPDEQAFLAKSLLNYEAPHFFAKFTIAGCPKGLEILDKYEHLVINRRLMNMIDLPPDKRLLAYSQYDIKNSRGMQLYIALEKTKRSSIRWFRDARLFEVNFFDFHCRKIFTVKRNFSPQYFFAQYLCLFCTFGFMGFGNSADVLLPDGTKLGTIKQSLSFSSIIFHIYDKDGNHVFAMDGAIVDGIIDVCNSAEPEPVAMVETLMTHLETFDFYRVMVPRYSRPYGITFFRNYVTPVQKALLLGAVILLDFIRMHPITDYPHLAEIIPYDFEEVKRPQIKTLASGSRELLILTEPEQKDLSTKAIGTRKECCTWCTRMVCLLCILGMRRNLLRFILLMIGITALVVLFAFGIKYRIHKHIIDL